MRAKIPRKGKETMSVFGLRRRWEASEGCGQIFEGKKKKDWRKKTRVRATLGRGSQVEGRMRFTKGKSEKGKLALRLKGETS